MTAVIEDMDDLLSEKIEQLEDGLNELGDMDGGQRYQVRKKISIKLRNRSICTVVLGSPPFYLSKQ